MSEDRMKKLLRAAEIIKTRNDEDTEIDNLVAISMMTGYQIGKMTATKSA